MKKTIIALATIVVFATSAHASIIYHNDGTTVELGDSVRVLLAKEKNKRVDLKNDDSRLDMKVTHQLGSGLSAVSGLEIRFDSEDNVFSSGKFGNPTTNKLFAGLAYEGIGTLTLGKQATNGDDVQLNDNAYAWGADNNLLISAEKSIKFRSVEWHGFSLGLDYVFGNANKKTSVKDNPLGNYEDKYAYQTSLFYRRGLAQDLMLNLAAGYGVNKYDYESTRTAYTNITWRMAAQVVYGSMSFGAEYGKMISKEHDTKEKTIQNLLVSVSYQVTEPSKVYVQWNNLKVKNHLAFGTEVDYLVVHNWKKSVDTLIVGADYKLHKNVLAYVEYAYEKAKATSDIYDYQVNPTVKVFSTNNQVKNNKLGVGLRVFF